MSGGFGCGYRPAQDMGGSLRVAFQLVGEPERAESNATSLWTRLEITKYQLRLASRARRVNTSCFPCSLGLPYSVQMMS